jgi:hypothetical protein
MVPSQPEAEDKPSASRGGNKSNPPVVKSDDEARLTEAAKTMRLA